MLFRSARTGLTGHSGPPTPPTVRKDKRKKKSPPHSRQKEKAKEKYILGRAWAPLLSALLLPLSSGGTLPKPTHPTLVMRKNSNTASVALPSHRYRTDGALGRSHLKASSTSLHSLLVCGRHAGHLVKRWCLDWGSPLAHHQQAGETVLPKRWRGVPVFAWPDSSW